ncbi:MAG: autotransporter domain-containing protein [Gammaproteobacteria bacterium]|nr:autotransporter domain-containing protein [Gammaproteobacteria bacterium]MYI76363.1 autotransporter domain-containing protein [Gammaproteobacteria bacterium]
MPQVIDAAKSGPEGGFVRYYFDDPTIDTDSADTPKVGYAREFTGTVRRQDGSVIPSNYIVGSGFYLTDPAVVTIRQNKVVQTVLPQVLRTMTASIVDAISDRIEQVTLDSSASPSTVFRLGGTSTLANAIFGRRDGSFLSNWLSEGSYFVLPLNAAHGGNGFLSHFTLWANADYRKLSDENVEVMGYDGNVTSANIGIDRKVGDDLVGGVSMTLASGTVDYEDPESAMGELSTSISSINPYLGWQMADNARLWAAAGFGWGEVEFTESTNSQASDLSQTMIAAGIDLSLMSSENLIKGGTTSIKLNSQSAFTSAEVDEGVSLEQTSLDASRHRVSLKGLHARTLKSAAVITPSIEAGWRIDGGDGTTGNGLEIGAGLGYSAGRMVLKLNSQTLLTHSDVDDFEDWSFRGMIALQPSSEGHGLSMSLGSSWGIANRDLESESLRSFSAERLPNQRESLMSTSPWIHAAVRYDFSKPDGLGLWTSYRGTDHDNKFRVMRVGLQFRSTQGFNAGLQIGRQESIHRSPHHSIELRGTLRW